MVKGRTGKVVKFDDVTGSAILVVRRSRYVINGLTSSDLIVVAARAAVSNTGMVIETRGEVTGDVTALAIVAIASDVGVARGVYALG